jgi:hypothetical protein
MKLGILPVCPMQFFDWRGVYQASGMLFRRKAGSSVHRFAQNNAEVDREELRDRLRRMSDERLLQFGEAAKFMCSKRANGNQPPRKGS